MWAGGGYCFALQQQKAQEIGETDYHTQRAILVPFTADRSRPLPSGFAD